MKIDIKIEKPLWSPYGTKPWWKCVHVRFEDETWVWQPTLAQLVKIMEKVIEAEKINREELANRNIATKPSLFYKEEVKSR